jgi:hypothetical protein
VKTVKKILQEERNCQDSQSGKSPTAKTINSRTALLAAKRRIKDIAGMLWSVLVRRYSRGQRVTSFNVSLRGR